MSPAAQRDSIWRALQLPAFLTLTLVPFDGLISVISTPLALFDTARVELTIVAVGLLTAIGFVGSAVIWLGLFAVCRNTGWDYGLASLRASAITLALFVSTYVLELGEGGPMHAGIRAVLFFAALATTGSAAYLAAEMLVQRHALRRRIAAVLPTACTAVLIVALGELHLRSQRGPAAINSMASIMLLLAAAIAVVGSIAFFSQARKERTAAIAATVLAAALSSASWLYLPGATQGERILSDQQERPNVVLISIDTMRADRLSPYSETAPATTNIEEFAGDALVFENAYSPAPWTLPGVASFLTGHTPAVHGADCRFCQLDDSVVTLGERFRDAGYATAAFGDNVNISRRNLLQGIGEHWFGPFPAMPANSRGFRAASNLFPQTFEPLVTSENITDHALDWLHQNRDESFFLWVHYMDPHVPYTVPEEWLAADSLAKEMSLHSEQLGNRVRSGEDFSQERKDAITRLYEREVVEVDRNIGRLLSRLRELDLYDDAVIVLSGDHGEELWDHGSYEHGHALYDELLRVPLLLHLPAGDRGRVARRVAITQIPATLLAAAGISTAGEYLGPSLSDSTTDLTLLIGSLLYYENQVGILDGDFKYTRAVDSGLERLVNLKDDPQERRLIDDAELLEDFRQRLATRLEAAAQLRKIVADDQAAPAAVPIDLLRSLGYL